MTINSFTVYLVMQADSISLGLTAEPGDDRYGVTVLQEVTMNMFGKVSREWWACAWFGTNPDYLVQVPKQPSRHTSSRAGVTSFICCACNVRGGGSPADWHPDCMEEWEKMQAEKGAAKKKSPKQIIEELVAVMRDSEHAMVSGRLSVYNDQRGGESDHLEAAYTHWRVRRDALLKSIGAEPVKPYKA